MEISHRNDYLAESRRNFELITLLVFRALCCSYLHAWGRPKDVRTCPSLSKSACALRLQLLIRVSWARVQDLLSERH